MLGMLALLEAAIQTEKPDESAGWRDLIRYFIDFALF